MSLALTAAGLAIGGGVALARGEARDLAALPEAAACVVGELHGNPRHHEGQGAVIAAVQPAAVVFEMLSPEAAARWSPAIATDLPVLDAAFGWADAGSPEIALHAPVFAAIPQGAAALGAAVPRDAVLAAMTEGAVGVFGAEAGRFGLAAPLAPEVQAAREADQQAAHCHALPEASLPAFVEAQRLRDAAFARVVLEALETYGPPVVLIAGTGHARTDRGVPKALAHAAPSLAVHAIGQIEGAPPAGAPFDALVASRPIDRPDPCEAFRAPGG